MLTKPLRIRPGVASDSTDYAQAHWTDARLMRFKAGWPETVGGWQSKSGVSVDGVCRSIWYGRDTEHNVVFVYGTDNGVWAVRGASEYDITPAAFNPVTTQLAFGTGFGMGSYGTGEYGTDRAAYATTAGRLPFFWSYDTWDEDTLILGAAQQGVYEWDFNTGNICTAVTNAPTVATGIMVSTEQHVVVFGADGNLKKVAWCDQGDRTVWTPLATNSAGDAVIPGGDLIRGWRRAGRGQYLIWMDNSLYMMSYVGYPDVYSFNDVAYNCGALSHTSIVAYGGEFFWMGETSFWRYRGGQPEPIQCLISRSVFQNLSEGNRVKATAMLNKQFDEIWWYYPSEGANENDKCLIFNTKTGDFSGPFTLARSAATVDAELVKPLAAWSTKIYEHENGETADGNAMTDPYVITPPIETDSGNVISKVRRILSDHQATNGIRVSILSKRGPQDSTKEYGPYEMANGDFEKAILRVKGRQFQLKFQPHSSGGFTRVGDTRLDIFPGGGR